MTAEPPQALADYPADASSHRLALVVAAVSLGGFLALVPFAKTPLPVAHWFIPLIQSALIINALITATLLFGQLRLTRTAAVLVLAVAYVFAALMASIHLLSFPGVFGPRGLVGGDAQTTAYLFIFWHTGFPALVLAYAMLKRRPRNVGTSWETATARGVLAIALTVAALALIAIVGEPLLPPVLDGTRYSPGFNIFQYGQWAVTGLAIAVLWRRRSGTVIDTWLLVALVAIFLEIGLVSIFNAGRYDLGFYVGRVYALLASSFVMLVLLNEQGKLYRDLAAAKTDMTAQRVAEEALRRADRRKDEFLATLAHELRNPLAPIRTSVELLSRAGALPPVVDQARKVIDRQSRHLARLVDDLMEVSRVSQGKLQLQRTTLSLATCLRDAVEAVRSQVDASGHRLTVELPDGNLVVHGDETRLNQCFVNLLTNAAKFTSAGGHITLKAVQDGDRVRVSVTDTGIGIDSDSLPIIFELFSQVAPVLQRSQAGLGIGLSLVRSIVELHGGQVVAHSAGAGRGSEFVVTLPLHTDPVPADPVAPAGPRTVVGQRILVVDDNQDAADSLTKVLQLFGHDARQAHDGPTALRMAFEFQPHVVLLDLGMPGMNGLEVARELRKQSVGSSVHLIALTGWGQDSDRELTRQATFDHHLTKPVEWTELAPLLGQAWPAGTTEGTGPTASH